MKLLSNSKLLNVGTFLYHDKLKGIRTIHNIGKEKHCVLTPSELEFSQNLFTFPSISHINKNVYLFSHKPISEYHPNSN